MFTTPDVRQVANWLRKALSGEPSKARPNQQTTHVEALPEGHQDAGSIPAASMGHRLSQTVSLFLSECQKVTLTHGLHRRPPPHWRAFRRQPETAQAP